MMKFVDGIKEIKVGQIVVYSNGQGCRNYRLIESTIEKIGNKLITLKNRDKFYLKDGSKKTIYVSGLLFSSKEAYDLYTEQNQFIIRVEQKLRGYSFRMTYEQAVSISKIIGD